MGLRRRMCVLLAGVCLIRTSGGIALTPHLGILGRGVHQVNGQWGSIVPAVGPTLGTALFVSRQPRDRMGFSSVARQHARYQLERDVHRIGRSIVDWRGIYGAFGSRQACESGLFREAHRAWTGYGSFRDACRWSARAALPRSSGFSLQHGFLSSTYTMLAAARVSLRGLRCVSLNSPPSFGTAFEVA
jgi:hypothetical protein